MIEVSILHVQSPPPGFKLTVIPAKVTGVSKNTSPLSAIGSLFSAPTMLYVVELVTRTHHALVYEMNTDERPEKIMAIMRLLRRSSGKFAEMLTDDQSSRKREQSRRIGMERRLL